MARKTKASNSRGAKAPRAPKKIVLFGTGDAARLAHVFFDTDSAHEVVAFTVDRAYCKENSFNGLPLVPFDEVRAKFAPSRHSMFVAMGYGRMNQLRAEKYAAARDAGYRLPSYVSSRCTYLSEHAPGDNCFILEDNTVQPFVRIGNNVTLWSGNHIGHDAVIKDHVFLASHIVVSGRTTIGEYCFLGVNATLRNGITIAPKCLIAAGAVIMADTVEGGVYLPPRGTMSEKKSDQINL